MLFRSDDLVAYAESVYGKGPSDYTDRKNALNRFVSYHLLDRYGSYSSLNCSDAEILNCFIDTEVPDVNHDFYETMHPYTLMKISSPKGVGMFINRKYRKRRLMIEGIRIFNPSEMSGIEQDAVNGIYHYIDNILVYDDQTKNDVLNTRFRIDATTLTPDFMNTGARGWKQSREYISYAFKPGFVKNFNYDSNTFFSCRQR